MPTENCTQQLQQWKKRAASKIMKENGFAANNLQAAISALSEFDITKDEIVNDCKVENCSLAAQRLL